MRSKRRAPKANPPKPALLLTGIALAGAGWLLVWSGSGISWNWRFNLGLGMIAYVTIGSLLSTTVFPGSDATLASRGPTRPSNLMRWQLLIAWPEWLTNLL